MLNITKNANGNALKIILEGRLDTTTAPQLEEQLNSALEGVTVRSCKARVYLQCRLESSSCFTEDDEQAGLNGHLECF